MNDGIELGDRRLTPADLEVIQKPLPVRVSDVARKRLRHCREYVDQAVDGKREIYGSTTGFGPLVDYAGRDTGQDQCDNILAHLGAGQGPDMPLSVVRSAMLVRTHSLCHGYSGVSERVVNALCAALGTSFTPAVPTLGSLGASGDLIPLAAVASALRGHGHAYVDGERLPADQALRRAGLSPVELDGRDGLALVNGTSVTAAAAGLALASLRRARWASVVLTAILVDILGASPAFADHRLLSAFGHGGARRVGGELRDLLTQTQPTGNRSLQEPYSIRCVPQLVGAVDDLLASTEAMIVDDLQSVSDNPLFFPEDDHVAHGGNFFGQPVAFAADLLTNIATQLGNLAERQLDLLIDPNRNSGLPPMVSTDPGRQHGVQGVQLAATAIVADMRRSATPASVQSVPTNLHNQDVVPFGTQAALNTVEHTRSLRWLHGSLAVALRQAVYVGGRWPTAPLCARVMEKLAQEIAPVEPDRPLHRDVRHAADVLDEIARSMPSHAATVPEWSSGAPSPAHERAMRGAHQ